MFGTLDEKKYLYPRYFEDALVIRISFVSILYLKGCIQEARVAQVSDPESSQHQLLLGGHLK